MPLEAPVTRTVGRGVAGEVVAEVVMDEGSCQRGPGGHESRRGWVCGHGSALDEGLPWLNDDDRNLKSQYLMMIDINIEWPPCSTPSRQAHDESLQSAGAGESGACGGNRVSAVS